MNMLCIFGVVLRVIQTRTFERFFQKTSLHVNVFFLIRVTNNKGR